MIVLRSTVNLFTSHFVIYSVEEKLFKITLGSGQNASLSQLANMNYY